MTRNREPKRHTYLTTSSATIFLLHSPKLSNTRHRCAMLGRVLALLGTCDGALREHRHHVSAKNLERPQFVADVFPGIQRRVLRQAFRSGTTGARRRRRMEHVGIVPKARIRARARAGSRRGRKGGRSTRRGDFRVTVGTCKVVMQLSDLLQLHRGDLHRRRRTGGSKRTSRGRLRLDRGRHRERERRRGRVDFVAPDILGPVLRRVEYVHRGTASACTGRRLIECREE